MRVLLDHGVPAQLRRMLPGHLVISARSCGWDRLANGDLLRAAESELFEVLLTTDQNLVYQQNNSSRSISLVVLGANALERLTACTGQIQAALERACPGSYEFVPVPLASKKR